MTNWKTKKGEILPGMTAAIFLFCRNAIVKLLIKVLDRCKLKNEDKSSFYCKILPLIDLYLYYQKLIKFL